MGTKRAHSGALKPIVASGYCSDCASEGVERKAQNNKWCGGYCKRHARAKGLQPSNELPKAPSIPRASPSLSARACPDCGKPARREVWCKGYCWRHASERGFRPSNTEQQPRSTPPSLCARVCPDCDEPARRELWCQGYCKKHAREHGFRPQLCSDPNCAQDAAGRADGTDAWYCRKHLTWHSRYGQAERLLKWYEAPPPVGSKMGYWLFVQRCASRFRGKLSTLQLSLLKQLPHWNVTQQKFYALEQAARQNSCDGMMENDFDVHLAIQRREVLLRDSALHAMAREDVDAQKQIELRGMIDSEISSDDPSNLQVASFGKYEGLSYAQIVRTDLSYALWAKDCEGATPPLSYLKHYMERLTQRLPPTTNYPSRRAVALHFDSVCHTPAQEIPREPTNARDARRTRIREVWQLPGMIGAVYPPALNMPPRFDRLCDDDQFADMSKRCTTLADEIVAYHGLGSRLHAKDRPWTFLRFASEAPGQSIHFYYFALENPEQILGQQMHFMRFLQEVNFIGAVWQPRGRPGTEPLLGTIQSNSHIHFDSAKRMLHPHTDECRRHSCCTCGLTFEDSRALLRSKMKLCLPVRGEVSCTMCKYTRDEALNRIYPAAMIRDWSAKDILHVAAGLGLRRQSQEDERTHYQRAQQLVQLAQASYSWYDLACQAVRNTNGDDSSYLGYESLAVKYGWLQWQRNMHSEGELQATQASMLQLLRRVTQATVPVTIALVSRSDVGDFDRDLWQLEAD